MLTVCGIGFSTGHETHRVRVQDCAIMEGVDIIATYGRDKGGACIIVSKADAAALGRHLIELAGELP